MKKTMMGLAILSFFGLSQAMAMEWTEDLVRSCMSGVKTQCEKWAAAGGGSGNPRGLSTEVAVELAMGERYMMYGTIVIYRNQPMLQVDFNEHGWLKNRRRVANPYYRIDSSDLERWKKLNRKYVAFAAVAQGALFVDDQGKKTFDIILQPTSEPLVNQYRSR